MDIQREIMPELWEAIQKKYETENYTDAILDAIYKITNTIRDKTGLESDGQELVGKAFGGDNPLIKVTKMQTDSDKSTQRGVMDMLKGLYGAVRNPRSHDTMTDSKVDADSIILFVNYLLKLIDNSKLRFSEEEFLERVFDPYYVNSDDYSELLVQSIPKRQRTDIAIKVILRRDEGDIYALGYFLKALLSQLSDADLTRVSDVVSNELKMATDDADFHYLIHIFPGKYWDKIEPSVKMRTESRLFNDFSSADYDNESDSFIYNGALTSWITVDHLMNFSKPVAWTRQTIEYLQSDNPDMVAYAEKYFWSKICAINRNDVSWPIENYLRAGLKNNDENIVKKFSDIVSFDKEHPWWRIFEAELKNHPEIKFFDINEFLRKSL